jgi:hypothetical protein
VVSSRTPSAEAKALARRVLGEDAKVFAHEVRMGAPVEWLFRTAETVLGEVPAARTAAPRA